MLKRTELDDLRFANPVAAGQANDLAAAIDLQGRVFAARAWQDNTPEIAAAHKPLRKIRRVRTWALAGAAVAFAAVLATTPALAVIRDVLPFWNAPKAPQPVQVEFSSMNTGAPAGMSPEAIANQTREIGQFTFGGQTHTLWVAPTNRGGFCFLWIGGWGGCNIGSIDPLTWNGDLVIPAGVTPPSIPTPPAGAGSNATTEAIMKARALAVPVWISGYVNASDARDVAIKFSDGTTIHPEIVWVSEPINAGFFSYDIPDRYQTEADHLVAVDALDANGSVVKEQPLRP
jgi:hypothetical protein